MTTSAKSLTPLPRLLTVLVMVFALVAAACTDDGGDSATGDPCERNAAVGTITVVTGFDFAASPGILDPIVAEAEGYFDELCLDVEIQPGFAPQNHTLVAAGEAQFANAGSFGEVVSANVNGDAGLVVVAHYGKTAIEALVVPADSPIQSLTDLAGTTVGIKGDLPYSLQTMIGEAGVERTSFDELLLDTFDPLAGFELGIDALPVYKSNEPIQLDNAGFAYRTFDPLDFDIPSSFGLLVVGEDFLAENPEVVDDFMRGVAEGPCSSRSTTPRLRCSMRSTGSPPTKARSSATTPRSPRWNVERQLVVDLTPPGEGYGQLDLDRLGAEIEALTEVGVFESLPDWESMTAAGIVEGIYDGGAEVPAWEPYTVEG